LPEPNSGESKVRDIGRHFQTMLDGWIHFVVLLIK